MGNLHNAFVSVKYYMETLFIYMYNNVSNIFIANITAIYIIENATLWMKFSVTYVAFPSMHGWIQKHLKGAMNFNLNLMNQF